MLSSLPDPGDQLCTDDFEGPSPHNVNLALKGVVGLGAYAQLLVANGQGDVAKTIDAAAAKFATQWLNMSADGSAQQHTRLQYDLPGTWSMKYNLLFQNILGLDIIPASMMADEVAFYKTKLQAWGLPLDSRSTLSKTDWTSWIAAMSTDSAFSTQLFQFLLKFVTQSPSRGVPFSDWYAVDTGAVIGFRARPVQGGLFAKFLLVNQHPQMEQAAEM